MTDASEILKAMARQDYRGADKLLPLVYEELRQLARRKLAHEKPGRTLGATALVHEAYVRLVGEDAPMHWNSRGHFFAAAAEAMRRILIENARARQRQKRGGELHRCEFQDNLTTGEDPERRLLEMDEALQRLEQRDERKARIVKLRFFVGLTNEEAAQALDISAATAARDWAYARAWLKREMSVD
jgi:RNA polymerase sigma factor (TIGR02999 family)